MLLASSAKIDEVSRMDEVTPNRIAEFRKAKGYTQQQLADMIGVHWITMSKFERSKVKLPKKYLSELAPLLGASISELMSGHEAAAKEIALEEAGSSPQRRLREARLTAGFATARAASRSFGWNANIYRNHENGDRAIGLAEIEIYASAFKVELSWIAFGNEHPASKTIVASGEHRTEIDSLGYRMLRIRTRMGIAQEHLAKACEVDQSLVIQWEENRAVPPADLMPIIAKTLRVSLLDIFGVGNPDLSDFRPLRYGAAHDEACRLINRVVESDAATRGRARDNIIALAERLKIEVIQGLT